MYKFDKTLYKYINIYVLRSSALIGMCTRGFTVAMQQLKLWTLLNIYSGTEELNQLLATSQATENFGSHGQHWTIACSDELKRKSCGSDDSDSGDGDGDSGPCWVLFIKHTPATLSWPRVQWNAPIVTLCLVMINGWTIVCVFMNAPLFLYSLTIQHKYNDIYQNKLT